MSTSFQPEKPQAPTRETSGRASVIWPAVIGGLLVTMLVALGLPAVLAFEGAGWGLALGAGVLTFLLILGFGFVRKTDTPTAEPEDTSSSKTGAPPPSSER